MPTTTPQLPNGFYQRKVNHLKTSWLGKKFDAKSSTGINIFKDGSKVQEKYPFKIYPAKALRGNKTILRIDYNLPQNPWWVRLVVDEIAATSSNNFLGKVNVSLLGLSFPIGHFSLKK